MYAKKVLVHYVGSLKEVIHNPHGNRKQNLERKHYMAARSQLNKQKTYLTLDPHKTYKMMVGENVHTALEPILLLRDSKQVRNTVSNERTKRLPSSDDIYSLYVYLVNSELDGFVQRLELLPDFYTI